MLLLPFRVLECVPLTEAQEYVALTATEYGCGNEPSFFTFLHNTKWLPTLRVGTMWNIRGDHELNLPSIWHCLLLKVL